MTAPIPFEVDGDRPEPSQAVNAIPSPEIRWPEHLDVLLALAGTATAGPWLAPTFGRLMGGEVHDFVYAPNSGDGYDIVALTGIRGKHERNRRDGEFIAAARAAVPQLVAEVRQLRAELDAETTTLDLTDEPESGAVRDRERDQWDRRDDGLWCLGGEALSWPELVNTWSPITRVIGPQALRPCAGCGFEIWPNEVNQSETDGALRCATCHVQAAGR